MIRELNLSRKKGDTLWALADPQQMLRFMLICYKITKDVPSDDAYWMDETHVDPRNKWRRKGWSNKGQRYYSKKHTGSLTQSRTILVFMNVRGVQQYYIGGPGETIDAEKFEGYLQRFIDWHWAKTGRVAYLIMDNAPVHQSDSCEKCRILWLPPYSPIINPCENVFSWVKHEIAHQRALPDYLVLRRTFARCPVSHPTVFSLVATGGSIEAIKKKFTG
ncbi:DDE superfamily endonuclease [Carpediemonas membranifera]|uniref:DDE superfamily endonuclease n=1 Tax=Carpediemonas membranifera TaxID=201153 RepID=A0A8J6B7J6_9EUKA|nr:DDE superfamily endonuclease [Carpediemonas membranifera]|eukprot:KAG9395899.1 DDE superfamily endonuclease [Carpediemonas membranifera]